MSLEKCSAFPRATGPGRVRAQRLLRMRAKTRAKTCRSSMPPVASARARLSHTRPASVFKIQEDWLRAARSFFARRFGSHGMSEWPERVRHDRQRRADCADQSLGIPERTALLRSRQIQGPPDRGLNDLAGIQLSVAHFIDDGKIRQHACRGAAADEVLHRRNRAHLVGDRQFPLHVARCLRNGGAHGVAFLGHRELVV